jgi:hypothetical protein
MLAFLFVFRDLIEPWRHAGMHVFPHTEKHMTPMQIDEDVRRYRTPKMVDINTLRESADFDSLPLVTANYQDEAFHE